VSINKIKDLVLKLDIKEVSVDECLQEYSELYNAFMELTAKVQLKLKGAVYNKKIDITDCKNFVSCLSASDIDEFFVTKSRVIPNSSCGTFSELLSIRSRKRIESSVDANWEWKLDHKLNSYNFIKNLGFAAPATTGPYKGYEFIRSLNFPICIKPLYGSASIGVFLLYSSSCFFDVYTSEYLSSFDDLYERIEYYIKNKSLNNNSWITEELIKSADENANFIPANYNFLCFYGKCEIARIIERSPNTADSWFDRQGNITFAGPVIDSKNSSFIKNVPEEYYELAESISKKIPVPFLRIDFNISSRGLIFNEFTPRPGSYKKFTKEWDRKLGIAFMDAEARLARDLLNQVRFDEFVDYIKLLK